MRTAQYLYLVELVRDKRVLEVGCGDGAAARFLAERGAARVTGIDPSASAIAQGRERHRLTNLELRCEDPRRIEIQDGSVDCVLLPDGAGLIRRSVVLDELRRVLAPGGTLVVIAGNADRPGSAGGVSYHEMVDRLSARFAPVHVVACAPVQAEAMVGFAPAAGEAVGEVVFDRSLASGVIEAVDYLAVCGDAAAPELAALTLVELPAGAPAARPADAAVAATSIPEHVTEVATAPVFTPWEDEAETHAPPPAPAPPPAGPTVSEQIAAALESHAQKARDLERALADALCVDEEVEAELEVEREQRLQLERQVAELTDERARLTRELGRFRDRAARSEGEVLRLTGELASRSDEPAVNAGAVAELEHQLSRSEQRGVELGMAVEEAEEARARLEARLAESEALADELRRALVDRRPGEAAALEAGAEARAALRRRVAQLEQELATAGAVLGELEEGISALADAQFEDSGESETNVAIELGVKDAELTLLNIGLSTLQQRMSRIVNEVKQTRRAMNGRPAGDVLALMDSLERSVDEIG